MTRSGLRPSVGRRWFLVLCLGLGTAAAAAEPLRDPTEPPAALRAPAANSPRPVAPPLAPLQLQGVWRREGSLVAMIDGKRLQPGDRIRDARVVAIGSDRVTLRGPAGRVTELHLLPSVRRPASEFVSRRADALAERR